MYMMKTSSLFNENNTFSIVLYCINEFKHIVAVGWHDTRVGYNDEPLRGTLNYS